MCAEYRQMLLHERNPTEPTEYLTLTGSYGRLTLPTFFYA